MNNAEKYKEEILKVTDGDDTFGFDKNTKEVGICKDIWCDNCLFKATGTYCEVEMVKWLLDEYREPNRF